MALGAKIHDHANNLIWAVEQERIRLIKRDPVVDVAACVENLGESRVAWLGN
jgi:hypothetical protein